MNSYTVDQPLNLIRVQTKRAWERVDPKYPIEPVTIDAQPVPSFSDAIAERNTPVPRQIYFIGKDGTLYQSQRLAALSFETETELGGKTRTKDTLFTPEFHNIPEPWTTTIEQWSALLRKIPEFPGNITHCAQMLQKFAEGMHRVASTVASIQNQPFTHPPLVLYFGEGWESIDTHYDTLHNEVVVGLSDILDMAQHDPQKKVQVFSKLLIRELVFSGLAGDWAKLAGVEEMDHAFKYQNEGLAAVSAIVARPIKQVEIDALPHELDSLRRQRQVAVEDGMMIETVQRLQLRIAAAEKLQKRLQPLHTTVRD